MKRIICSAFVLMALFCCHNLSAGCYAGGSFSFASSWNNVQQGSLVNSSSIVLSPELGWLVGEKWTVGIKPSVGVSATSANDARNIHLGISPYARYRFLEFKKFGLWAEMNAEFSYLGGMNASGGDTRTLSYGIGVRPVLTYDLSRRISLYGAVNLFSLSLRGYSTYYQETSKWFNSFSIGLAGQSDNVIDSLSQISVGFIYKF